MPNLATERLLLRDLTSSDVTEAFVQDMVAAARSPERGSFTWAVTAAGVVLGACSVTVTSVQHRRGEMGYVLARTHWGQGYASEAAAAVLDFARDELALERVEATCRPANVASQRVLRKIGMQQEGLLRSHMLIRGQREDSLLFATVG